MKTIKLPYATSFTDTGPLVEMKEASVIIRYDYQNDEGQIFWTKITFGIVYGYKYLESEYLDTHDYEFGLVEITNSQWLQEMIDVWKQGGNDPKGAFGSEPEKVHHYRIYFDDDGLHEVICKTIEISEEN